MTSVGRRLLVAMWLASIEIKVDRLACSLERRYRPDQPRAPTGTPIGGQWIDDVVHVAARGQPRCDGFASGCQNGGSFGSSGMIKIQGKLLCWDCAIKFLGIQDLSRDEQMELIEQFDPKAFK